MVHDAARKPNDAIVRRGEKCNRLMCAFVGAKHYNIIVAQCRKVKPIFMCCQLFA